MTAINAFRDTLNNSSLPVFLYKSDTMTLLNPIQAGGFLLQVFPCCAETACSRLMKLSDF